MSNANVLLFLKGKLWMFFNQCLLRLDSGSCYFVDKRQDILSELDILLVEGGRSLSSSLPSFPPSLLFGGLGRG